ncbi:DUF4198 domain-containing protein [Tautonia plasticadhaerens]|uniref:Nickel uptake substrate-specific transmembrane region n=1 Tax=Tautonia plasticadhaerens TaxID=2527974 RepID=A0A518GWL8_9BACT|nr:DUF4198 domain-containing protein [Tautonia plasticadhaerens]QDV32951.1 Nickel uptake substrate-specific transmembrane region [Tautonia plasticadhaerens]
MTRGRAIRGIGAIVAAATLSGAVGRATAHEIKVLAGRLVTEPGTRDTVYLSWGHILPVDMPVDAEAIKDYRLHTPSGSVSYLATEGYSLHANEVTVEEEGLYTAEVTRHPSLYTVVVDEHGQHRHLGASKAEARAQVQDGTIDYSARSHQFAKAMLISGHDLGHGHSHEQASPSAGEPATKVLGHDFEIVPLDGPEAWTAGADLRVQVLFQGEPAARQDVFARFIGFKPDQAWCFAIPTDNEGIASIRVDRPGTWIIRAQKILPAAVEDREQFDVESFTATVALEVLP